MKRLDGLTHDTVAARIEELRALFPEVFKDGKIDFDALQNALGEYVEDAREKYSFTWAGKTDAIRLAQKRSTGTLRPCVEESVNFDTTQNLYIEGDNLEVLKLLAGSYMNRVKMIYIDPPYNTGNDFVYNDSFADGIENYKKIIGETAKSNPETAGRFHTNWLNMMLPRLKLARTLLTPDGVIFISIDDNEFANLKKICDEIFGEDNHIGTITWEKRTKCQNTTTARELLQSKTEYILCYKKHSDKMYFRLEKVADKEYDLTDEKGCYREKTVETMSALGMRGRTTMQFDILGIAPSENKQWKIGRDQIDIFIKRNDIFVRGKEVILKIRPDDENNEIFKPFWSHFFDKEAYGTAEVGKSELIKTLGTAGSDFETVKPVSLIKSLISHIKDDNNDFIVLDFFSGSGTTAHAVMQLNVEDGGKRRFICVQIPELFDINDEAHKAGYKNLCDIGKLRIRRAGEQLAENGNAVLSETERVVLGETKIDPKTLTRKAKVELSKKVAAVDIGFKVFKLDSSNLRKWDNGYTRDYEQLSSRILDYYDYMVEGRKAIDLVYEIMLKYSLPLTLPVSEVTAAGATAHIISHAGDESVDAYKVLVCMQADLGIEQMEALSGLGCGTLFFADRCFTDTNAMTNCDEILKKAEQEMRLF